MGTFLKVFGGISFLVVAVFVGLMFLSPATPGYTPSDTVLEANQIVKNPYKFKGMSGIMSPWGMHFSHMAGDQTAVYDIYYNDDQLAVIVEDNEPPQTKLWWRVYVEGTDDFTNGLGASMKVAEVRFEGYTDPPPQPAPVQPQSQPEPQPIAPPLPPTQTPTTDPDGTQPPAPIERRTPPQD